MYLFVILPFESALAERGIRFLAATDRYVHPQRVWSFLGQFFRNSFDFGHFGLKLGMVLYSSLELGMIFRRSSYFSSFTIRPVTKAIHNTFNIILN